MKECKKETLLYDVPTLARIIINNDLSVSATHNFLIRVWKYDGLFLCLEHRFNKRKFLIDVWDEVNYWQNKKDFDKEISAVNRDFQTIGSDYYYYAEDEYYDLRSYFMELRLRMIFLDNQEYVRMKLRTLLHDHGYQRRSAGINEYLKQCMFFYHIESFVRGGELCDIEEIDIDDMITFRVLENPREYIIKSEEIIMR